ncbi:DUF3800 domain-containing protein [Paracoccus sp. EF6]|uniref:DUF3800 domain-containing protein n=2 Tax=Paracoccus benzoatiresistens TaxID=2997341 RepID=A0ABT4J8J1_9RHOB|nr:DUF3800 domain-containing protein [Paracoccus sp. EF6]
MRVRPGIYVDDSGNPGTDSGSIHLSKTRKSWTAVIIPPSLARVCSQIMDIFLKGIKQDHCATELHFTDIFSGRGVWKKVDIEDRIKMFRLMASFVARMELPIVHVTTSQETLNDHSLFFKGIRLDSNQFWDISVPRFGFLRCCLEISEYAREMRAYGHPDFNDTLPMFADEGLAVAGSIIPLPNWGDVIYGPSVRFSRSQDVAGIQIADFAAFTISRTQWIVAQRRFGTPVSRSDEEFLRYGAELNVVNLPRVSVQKTHLSKEHLESILEQDRISKGLTSKPLKS